MDWRSAAQRDLAAAYSAAKELSGGAAQAACSEAGFRAVLGTPSAGPAYYAWGALLGLQGLLVTQGHYDEAVRLIDSTVAAGTSQALMLYIVDLWAGAPTNAKAAEVDAFVRRTFRGDYRALSPQSQWLLGIWHAYRGDATRLRTLLVVLAAQARTPGARRAGLLADALAAHLALVTGDTTGAIRRLQALAPTARRDSLSRELSEALPVERLLLARLLLARGQRAEALSVAAAFDQPEPVVYLPFVAASLAVRVRAAEALGLTAVAARARTRLLALGRSDLLKATSSPIEGRHR